MYKSIIENINTLQESRISTVCQNGKLKLPDKFPPTKQEGLYWIYAKYTDQDFLNSIKSPQKNSVDLKNRVNRHLLLNNICNKKVDEFRVVYNGIGGSLRNRILAEFRGGEGTGSLAVCESSLKDLDKWRFSYVLWSEIDFNSIQKPHGYGTISRTIELLWRIHYGWPILCAK